MLSSTSANATVGDLSGESIYKSKRSPLQRHEQTIDDNSLPVKYDLEDQPSFLFDKNGNLTDFAALIIRVPAVHR